MRGILLVVLLLAGCEAKRKQPAKQPAHASAVAPAPRATERPSLPAEKPRPYKLDREVFIWSFAEASNTAAAWTTTAEVFEQELAGCTTNCTETAYEIVLARKNALRADPIPPPAEGEEPPKELPPRVQAVVDALDQYIALGDPTDPQVAGAKFLAGSTMYRWQQQDAAIARLEAILREHRDQPVAEYAANQLLDMLMRAGRMTELRSWALELLADETFLAGKDELRATLERIRTLTEPGAQP